MKKLYTNINEIEIHGKPFDLYEVVTALDKRIESLSNETNEVRAILYKYLNSNAGNQYEKATITVHKLGRELESSAIEINELQIQVCKFVEKANEYDLRNDGIISPRKSNVVAMKVPANPNIVQYDEREMKIVLFALTKYVQDTLKVAKLIKCDKDEVGKIWRDRQYLDFSKEIDDLTTKIQNSVEVLKDYAQSLDEHIRKLSS